MITSSQRTLLAVAATGAFLSACGGGGDPSSGVTAASEPSVHAHSALPPANPAIDPAAACASLLGRTIDPAYIGLPTSGAVVSTATMVAAPTEYCLVTGAIRPVDPSAQDIVFEIALPTNWNGKGFQFGGGGFDGTDILVNPTPDGNPPTASGVTPLARGYVSFTSDSGHSGEPLFTAATASFALNEEQLRNYAADAIKKVHDVADGLAKYRYGKGLGGTYFIGGSKGGQEALAAAQRWPQDYLGVVALYPAWSFVNAFSSAMHFTQVSLSPGGFLNSKKQALITQAVVAACDALDGASDGIIANPSACHFDPVVLRCANGVDTGDTCLSDTQIATLHAIDDPWQPAYSVKNGVQGYPGFPVLSGTPVNFVQFGTSDRPSPNPTTGLQSLLDPLVTGFVKYFVTKDPLYDQMQYDTFSGSGYVDRLKQLSNWLDTSDSMAPFFAKGGKLIMVHGTADNVVSPGGSIQLFNRIRSDVGSPTARNSMKFYMVPGMGHLAAFKLNLDPFTLGWNPLSAIEHWAEGGVAPAGLVATDTNTADNGRSRPMCEYGTYPKYNGSGDINVSTSYSCVSTSK